MSGCDEVLEFENGITVRARTTSGDSSAGRGRILLCRLLDAVVLTCA